LEEGFFNNKINSKSPFESKEIIKFGKVNLLQKEYDSPYQPTSTVASHTRNYQSMPKCEGGATVYSNLVS
jgi:hypothetical protein